MKFTFLVLFALLYLPLPAQNKSSVSPDRQKPFFKNQTIPSSDSYSSISFTQMMSIRNYYDDQSKGSPQQIWQDPNNPDNIHAVFTYGLAPTGTLWQTARVYYMFSSNKGVTWTTTLVDTGRVQLGTITGLSDGRALIACTAGPSEPLINYTRIFVQNSVGSTTFTRLLPGGPNYVNPRIIATNSTSLTNKFLLISSDITVGNPTQSYLNLGTSLSSNSFTSYSPFTTAGAYRSSLGRGDDGRIGIVTTMNSDVYFIESTDNGSTFSTPLLIFQKQTSGDYYGAGLGACIVYQENTPKIFFDVQPIDAPSYNKGALKYWSPVLSGSDPNRCVSIADSTNVFYSNQSYAIGFPNIHKIGRPSAGVSSDGSTIFCTFMVRDTNSMYMTWGGTLDNRMNYYDVYLISSSDGGTTWSTPDKLTSNSTPKYDWSYPSISPTNDYDANFNYVNIILQKDTIPGSWMYRREFTEQELTNSKPFFIRAAYTRPAPLPPGNLASPANNQNGVVTNPTLSWMMTSGATSYKLQISTDRYFSNIIYTRTNLTSPNHQVAVGTLGLNTDYWWRIQPVIGAAAGLYSDGWGFHTRTTGVQNVSSNVPSVYKLYNNYPNPFNPATKIKFDLPKNSYVKINVFDVTGRMINEIVNQNLSAGSYETEFNGSNLSSGIYYYRIEAGDFVETKKMILVK
ncbi:MAG: T9SS type A sorting domain-containing protein [Ignavibacteria bacterium]|nr:T9SS type A sorting domain-containing protein [Ignavibacteria bacterium]